MPTGLAALAPPVAHKAARHCQLWMHQQTMLWTYLLRHGHVNGQLHACHEPALVVALNLLVVTSHALKGSEMEASTPQ